MSESYELRLTENAKDDLKRLDKAAGERILKKMLWVAEHAHTLNHTELTGEWSGLCRWRAGDYRIIYALYHERRTLIVEVVPHRRDVYGGD